MAQMELPKPLPYSISPESNKPKIMYLPSFANIVVPGKTAVREEFQYRGYPGRTYEGLVTDTVETFVSTSRGEVIGRTVSMAPTLFVDEEALPYFPQVRQAGLLRDIMDAYEWILDETSIMLRAKSDLHTGGFAAFTLLVNEHSENGSYADVFPDVGERLYLEENPDRVTLQHIDTEGGSRLYEKIVHLENVPGGPIFPVYAGVLYEPDLLEFPKLRETALMHTYNPAVFRQKFLPFISVKYD